MKETKTITLKNEAILIRLEPALKARLMDFAKSSNKSAAGAVRYLVDAYTPNRKRKSA